MTWTLNDDATGETITGDYWHVNINFGTGNNRSTYESDYQTWKAATGFISEILGAHPSRVDVRITIDPKNWPTTT